MKGEIQDKIDFLKAKSIPQAQQTWLYDVCMVETHILELESLVDVQAAEIDKQDKIIELIVNWMNNVGHCKGCPLKENIYCHGDCREIILDYFTGLMEEDKS